MQSQRTRFDVYIIGNDYAMQLHRETSYNGSPYSTNCNTDEHAAERTRQKDAAVEGSGLGVAEHWEQGRE